MQVRDLRMGVSVVATLGYLLALAPAHAANIFENVRPTSAPILDIDPSVRSVAMGGASTAVFWGDGPSHWANPALLGTASGVRFDASDVSLLPEAFPGFKFRTRRVTVGYGGLGVALNNAFTPPLQQGCAQAAKDLGVECIFVGPTEYNEAQEVQMLQDMIQRGVDGLAVSAANPKAMAKALQQAKDKGIPVVMFDSDVLAEDRGVRLTFIGTDNYAFGAELAKAVLATKKSGGTVCIQSGAAASLNLNERVQGIRDTLAGVSKDKTVKRLNGQNGWSEPAGCPVYNNDDVRLAAQQVNDVFTSQPKLSAFVAVGGWAQYAPEATKRQLNCRRTALRRKTW